jgi:membrane protein implicated in regulation of membrane protease activity
VALAITVAVLATRRDVAYGLVVVWAVAGIAVKQSNSPNIVLTAEAAIVIILIALVLSIVLYKFRRQRQLQKQKHLD